MCWQLVFIWIQRKRKYVFRSVVVFWVCNAKQQTMASMNYEPSKKPYVWNKSLFFYEIWGTKMVRKNGLNWSYIVLKLILIASLEQHMASYNRCTNNPTNTKITELHANALFFSLHFPLIHFFLLLGYMSYNTNASKGVSSYQLNSLLRCTHF